MPRTALLALLLLEACAGETPCAGLPGETTLRAELFFGRNAEGGLRVTDADWAEFERTTLTGRFPGFTVLDAKGIWRGEGEPTKLVVILAERSPRTLARLDEVIADYKSRFSQQSVLVTTAPACAAF